MKTYAYIIIGIILSLICFSLISCNNNVPPVEKIIYIPVKDTIFEKNNIARIVELEHKCYLLQDSLNTVKDSLGEDLFISKYKLSRIKYYVDVAAKGNNIKYLRGWCLRVLNE